MVFWKLMKNMVLVLEPLSRDRKSLGNSKTHVKPNGKRGYPTELSSHIQPQLSGLRKKSCWTPISQNAHGATPCLGIQRYAISLLFNPICALHIIWHRHCKQICLFNNTNWLVLIYYKNTAKPIKCITRKCIWIHPKLPNAYSNRTTFPATCCSRDWLQDIHGRSDQVIKWQCEGLYGYFFVGYYRRVDRAINHVSNKWVLVHGTRWVRGIGHNVSFWWYGTWSISFYVLPRNANRPDVLRLYCVKTYAVMTKCIFISFASDIV